MNSCQVNLSAVAAAKALIARFHVVPQTSPFALHNGFTHMAYVVSHNPYSPFSSCDRGIPFTSEEEAHDYCKNTIGLAINHILKFSDEDRVHLAQVMLREDNGVYKVHATYDALLIAYLPQLVACFTPLPMPSVNVSKFVDHYTDAESNYALGNEWYMAWTEMWSRNVN